VLALLYGQITRSGSLNEICKQLYFQGFVRFSNVPVG
jgi:hypothetical protein